MDNLTGFQRDILYVTAGLDEPHGLAIKEELEDYYESEIQHGRLYPNLDTLVEEGLIEKGEIDNATTGSSSTSRPDSIVRCRTRRPPVPPVRRGHTAAAGSHGCARRYRLVERTELAHRTDTRPLLSQ
jgi:hypothetical protein